MTAEQHKRKSTPPDLTGCLYFDEKGNRITRAEFTKEKPYTVTVQAMTDHLAALEKWMRSEATA